MAKKRHIEPVVTKVSMHSKKNDFAYWQTQTPQARLEALEEIRQEYHLRRYGAEPRLQRVYRIVKR